MSRRPRPIRFAKYPYVRCSRLQLFTWTEPNVASRVFKNSISRGGNSARVI